MTQNVESNHLNACHPSFSQASPFPPFERDTCLADLRMRQYVAVYSGNVFA